MLNNLDFCTGILGFFPQIPSGNLNWGTSLVTYEGAGVGDEHKSVVTAAIDGA